MSEDNGNHHAHESEKTSPSLLPLAMTLMTYYGYLVYVVFHLPHITYYMPGVFSGFVFLMIIALISVKKSSSSFKSEEDNADLG